MSTASQVWHYNSIPRWVIFVTFTSDLFDKVDSTSVKLSEDEDLGQITCLREKIIKIIHEKKGRLGSKALYRMVSSPFPEGGGGGGAGNAHAEALCQRASTALPLGNLRLFSTHH